MYFLPPRFIACSFDAVCKERCDVFFFFALNFEKGQSAPARFSRLSVTHAHVRKIGARNWMQLVDPVWSGNIAVIWCPCPARKCTRKSTIFCKAAAVPLSVRSKARVAKNTDCIKETKAKASKQASKQRKKHGHRARMGGCRFIYRHTHTRKPPNLNWACLACFAVVSVCVCCCCCCCCCCVWAARAELQIEFGLHPSRPRNFDAERLHT